MSSELYKAKKPLAAARVEVIENEENPGYYAAKFYLRPHYQLEGMDIGLSFVSRLPGPAHRASSLDERVSNASRPWFNRHGLARNGKSRLCLCRRASRWL